MAVTTPDILAPYCERVTEVAKAVVAKTLDTDRIPDAAWDQLTLPGRFGGCGIRVPDQTMYSVNIVAAAKRMGTEIQTLTTAPPTETQKGTVNKAIQYIWDEYGVYLADDASIGWDDGALDQVK